mmetsp:Transcript_18959/g.51949  ORF Transcript_18959/g.51949 Transcript_18959/m.51949 type:complete len:88 (-) Transcript_18959:1592-1855(-)
MFCCLFVEFGNAPLAPPDEKLLLVELFDIPMGSFPVFIMEDGPDMPLRMPFIKPADPLEFAPMRGLDFLTVSRTGPHAGQDASLHFR